MSFRGQLIKAGITTNGSVMALGTAAVNTVKLGIGASTTGINFAGLISGQVINYTTVTSVGDTTSAHLIRYGTSSAEIIYTPTVGGSHSGIQMYITSDDCRSGLSLAAIRARVTLTGTTKATAYGGQFWVKISTEDVLGYTGDYQGGHPDAIIGVIEIPTSAVVISSSIYATMTGVTGEVRPILGTVTQTGTICAVRALVQSTATNIASGTLAGLMVQTTAAGSVDVGVLIQPHIGSTITTGIHLDAQYGTITTGITVGACTTAISISGTCTTGIDLSGCTGAGSNIILGGYGRISTSTYAGAALDLDASFTQNEGLYLRYSISSWTGIGDEFYGAFIRAQTDGLAAATGKRVTAAELYAVGSDTMGQLRGLSAFAYVKGSGAKTVGPIYGVSAELTYDGGQAAQSINTEAMPLRCKIGLGNVTGAQALKVHGIQLYMFSMEGASVLLGNGIEMKDGTETGTTTLTVGIKISIGCVTGISIAAASTTTLGVSITGIMGGATSRGVKSEITINNCAFTDGYAANELNLTTTGTDAGYPAAAGSWVNVNSTCVAGYYVLARSDGIWENQADSGDVTDAKIIFGARVQAQLTNTPERVCPWSLNVSGCTITALYDISTFHSTIGYTADSSEGTTKVGAVAFMVDVAGNKQYIRLYSSVS